MLTGLYDWVVDFATYIPSYLMATGVVVAVTVLTILLSWICGLITAFAKLSRVRLFHKLADFYVWFVRGTPTLIQVFIVYFGFPQLGMKLSPFVAGTLALGVSSGAYVAETIRSGLTAIPKGQMESSLALGMTRTDAMLHIILPQVFRIILPSLTNEAISALKNTSLLSTISVMELTLYTQLVIAATFRPFDFYIASAFLYLVMTTVLSRMATWLERRQAIYR